LDDYGIDKQGYHLITSHLTEPEIDDQIDFLIKELK
jgi:hypothetical protein